MTCRSSSRGEEGPRRVPVGIHPYISIPRDGRWQSSPWQPLRCLLPSLCPVLGAHRGPTPLSPSPCSPGRESTLAMSLAGCTRLQGTLQDARSLHGGCEFWEGEGHPRLTTPVLGAPRPTVWGRQGGSWPSSLGQGEGGAHSLGTPAGHPGWPLPALARHPGSTQRAGRLRQQGCPLRPPLQRG